MKKNERPLPVSGACDLLDIEYRIGKGNAKAILGKSHEKRRCLDILSKRLPTFVQLVVVVLPKRLDGFVLF